MKSVSASSYPLVIWRAREKRASETSGTCATGPSSKRQRLVGLVRDRADENKEPGRLESINGAQSIRKALADSNKCVRRGRLHALRTTTRREKRASASRKESTRRPTESAVTKRATVDQWPSGPSFLVFVRAPLMQCDKTFMHAFNRSPLETVARNDLSLPSMHDAEDR